MRLATTVGLAVALVALFLWVTHEKQKEKVLLSMQLAKCELAGAKAELESFKHDLEELQLMIDKALVDRMMFLKWMEEMRNSEIERTITKAIGKDLGTTVYQLMTYERNYKETEKRKSFRSSKSCPIVNSQ